ncbi:hypothetical protein A9G11_09910 [Gilliamella sp. wkB108]|nr:hypothetical protein A9G11_09910 [Gilliamella apicola]
MVMILMPERGRIVHHPAQLLTLLQIKLLLNTPLYHQGKLHKPQRQTQFMKYREQMVLEVLLIMMQMVELFLVKTMDKFIHTDKWG